MRIFYQTTIILTVAILLPVMLGDIMAVLAQEGSVAWSASTNITDTPTRSNHQFIVSDPQGYVHVFWSEDFDGSEIPAPIFDDQGIVIKSGEEGSPGNTIFYRRWDGKAWSEPVDLFFSTFEAYNYPTAAIDEEGTLYLIWVSSAGVHFSSAPAQAATSAQAWIPDTIIAPATGFRPALLVRSQGELSVVYSAFTQIGYGKDGNIFHIGSVDGGQSWSEPVQISLINSGTETLAVFPRLIEDGKGRLHLVWYETDPPGFTGSAVYYTRSTDGGETWSLPLTVDQITPESSWAAAINIAVTGDEEIHLVWVCGDKTYRCHQWSTDGGISWTPVRRLFGELQSLANWDALATDASGNIYWVMQLRFPYGLYYTYWDGGRWLDPPILFNGEPLVNEGHGVQLTISRGNELHLVVHHPSVFEIWHIQGISALTPEQEPQPMPTVLAPTFTPTVSPSATPMVAPTATREIRPLQVSEEESIIDSQGPATGLIIGIIPVVLIVGVVALFKLSTRRN